MILYWTNVIAGMDILICLRLANRDIDIINCKIDDTFVINKEIFISILST
jgi:hypothetical protein